MNHEQFKVIAARAVAASSPPWSDKPVPSVLVDSITTALSEAYIAGKASNGTQPAFTVGDRVREKTGILSGRIEMLGGDVRIAIDPRVVWFSIEKFIAEWEPAPQSEPETSPERVHPGNPSSIHMNPDAKAWAHEFISAYSDKAALEALRTAYTEACQKRDEYQSRLSVSVTTIESLSAALPRQLCRHCAGKDTKFSGWSLTAFPNEVAVWWCETCEQPFFCAEPPLPSDAEDRINGKGRTPPEPTQDRQKGPQNAPEPPEGFTDRKPDNWLSAVKLKPPLVARDGYVSDADGKTVACTFGNGKAQQARIAALIADALNAAPTP